MLGVTCQYEKKWKSGKFNTRCILYCCIVNLDNIHRPIKLKWAIIEDLIALVSQLGSFDWTIEVG